MKRSDVRVELLGFVVDPGRCRPRHDRLHAVRSSRLEVRTAFVLADVVGVLALAVVGIGTAGGRERPLGRRILYVVGLVAVGVAIVGLESVVHLL